MATMREKFEELRQAVAALREAPVYLMKGRAAKVQQLTEELLLMIIERLEKTDHEQDHPTEESPS